MDIVLYQSPHTIVQHNIAQPLHSLMLRRLVMQWLINKKRALVALFANHTAYPLTHFVLVQLCYDFVILQNNIVFTACCHVTC